VGGVAVLKTLRCFFQIFPSPSSRRAHSRHHPHPGMAEPAPSPGRAALRDLSNEATPSPCARKAQSALNISNQATPPQSEWTNGTQFRFVEEDDDEVLFRVRDSGVLRSLALPELTRPEVVTPPNAVNADETLEQKQVPVRASRLRSCRLLPRSASCSLRFLCAMPASRVHAR